MLVLTRRPEEEIIIGNSITIKVVRIQGHQVSIGISAPPDIPVHRREIYDALRREAEKKGARKQNGGA